MKKMIFLSISLLLFFVACDDDKKDSPVAAMCSKYFSCCPNGAAIDSFMAFDSQSECEMFLSFLRAGAVSEYKNNSRIKYDEASDTKCTALNTKIYNEITCGQSILQHPSYKEMTEVCNNAFQGTVKEGESCENSEECIDGLYCSNSICTKGSNTINGDNTILQEACINRSNGVACDPDTFVEQCQETLYCSTLDKKCTEKLGENGACERGNECKDEYYCSNNLCTKTKGLNEQCTSSFQCSSDLYCDDNSDVCIKRKANGAACSFSDECLSDFCDFDTKKCTE